MALSAICRQAVWKLEYKNLDHITYPENKLRIQNDDGESSVDGDGAN
jgi:hypothetical protein